MRTRMERYLDNQNQMARTRKNQDLYEDIYANNSLPSSNETILNNESVIDISKIKELVQNREGYKRIRDYKSIIEPNLTDNEEEEYDIYEDIDNKIYDINMILEEARSKRGEASEREKYRALRNTQYDILSKLNLDEEPEKEEMDTDFFTKDKTLKGLVESICDNTSDESKKASNNATSADLFEDLKGSDNTVLTEAITNDNKIEAFRAEKENTFYTDHLNFTQEDFEGFQNLQTTVKKNNTLIKVLISILVIILISVVLIIAFTLL